MTDKEKLANIKANLLVASDERVLDYFITVERHIAQTSPFQGTNLEEQTLVKNEILKRMNKRKWRVPIHD